jgi:hypothetical protein
MATFGRKAADALHSPRIDAESFGYDAHAGPFGSRQGLADSIFEGLGAIGPRKRHTDPFPEDIQRPQV